MIAGRFYKKVSTEIKKWSEKAQQRERERDRKNVFLTAQRGVLERVEKYKKKFTNNGKWITKQKRIKKWNCFEKKVVPH